MQENSQEQLKGKKVALVHDFLTSWGGAELVLEALTEIFSQAPIYTLLYDKKKLGDKFKKKEIRTSFLEKFPSFCKKSKKWLIPFLPTAPETFDLRDFDLIVSSSGAWSKGIVTRVNTVHIAYLHSPMRFVWDYNLKYLQEKKEKMNLIKRWGLSYLRLWDFEAGQRPDYLIANSQYTQRRIAKYYRRKSKVIYPGVSLEYFAKQKPQKENYFLVVSRLSPYKKVDLVVETFNKLELPLVVIGEGEQKKYLQKIAGKTVKIIGWQNEKKVREYYQKARAFIFPALDDFGLTMIEAMSQGTPVIALKQGGAKEIIQEGKTGEFFNAMTIEVLADGVRRFLEKERDYEFQTIQAQARKFTQEKFQEEILKYIQEIISI